MLCFVVPRIAYQQMGRILGKTYNVSVKNTERSLYRERKPRTLVKEFFKLRREHGPNFLLRSVMVEESDNIVS